MTTRPRPEALVDPTCSCPEFSAASLSRRGLFRGAALAAGATTFGSAVVTMTGGSASAAVAPAPAVLVVLSLRGAADGLSLVVPHGDPVYYQARPTIAIPRETLLAQDSFFGLHPSLAPLLPMWDAGKLAAVHATGLPVANRSHFSAMEEVEDADPGSAARIGWLNRLIGLDAETSSLQGVSVGTTAAPASLTGPSPYLALSDLSRIEVAGGEKATDPTGRRTTALTTVWGRSTTAYGAGMRSALASTESLRPAFAQPDNSASYPATDLGKALSTVARTLRADVGVATVTVDQGDWDMHADLGTLAYGPMQSNTRYLAQAMAAFFADLGPVADKVTLVTISEFGRRVAENANRGLDHGWGNVMFLAGAGVKGGRYYGSWPDLSATLDADVRVTTDYRSVLSEVVTRRMGGSSAKVFPGFTPTPVGVIG